MVPLFLFLTFSKIASDCVAPFIDAIILENEHYFGEKTIAYEKIKSNTTIKYFCRDEEIFSVCENDKWQPEIDFTYCTTYKYCTAPTENGMFNILGAVEGNVFEHFETISFLCNGTKVSIFTGSEKGLSVCRDGTFWPPLACYEKAELCEIPLILNGVVHDNLKNFKFIPNGTALFYFCDNGYGPKMIDSFYFFAGISECVDGEYKMESFPQCLKKCDTNTLKNIKPLITGNGLVLSGAKIKYFCDEDHPVSLDNIKYPKKIKIKLGMGATRCVEGSFSPLNLCFSGCLMPKNVFTDSFFVINGQTASFSCSPNGPLRYVTCENNRFDYKVECDIEENDFEYCNFENSEFARFLDSKGMKLELSEMSIYECPSETPISGKDVENFNKGKNYQPVLGIGVLNCPITKIPTCFSGCVVPLNINAQRMFVYSGETIHFSCSGNTTSATERSFCNGTVFQPEINCFEVKKPVKCYFPNGVLEIFRNGVDSVAQGETILIECNYRLKTFECGENGNWSPPIPESCIKKCKFNASRAKNINFPLFENYEKNKVYKYHCAEHYSSVSHGEQVGYTYCTPFGMFYPEPKCQPDFLSCLKPLLKNTLTINVNKYRVFLMDNESIEYQCLNGYTSESNTLKCESTTLRGYHECKKSCRIYKNQYNAEFENNSLVKFNTFVKYTCDRLNNPIRKRGVLYCLNDGQFEHLHWRICLYTCEFPEQVHISSKPVLIGDLYNYTCSYGKKGVNLKCDGIFTPLCQKPACIVPNIRDALEYFIIIDNDVKLSISPYKIVANSSKIEVNCGIFKHVTSCIDENWEENIDCEKCSDIFIKKECDLLSNPKYALIDNYTASKISVGHELEYNCVGNFTGRVTYRCTKYGPEIIGLCDNECQINEYFFGLKSIISQNIKINEKFEFTCVEGTSKLSQHYYCYFENGKFKIWPEKLCAPVE